MNLRSGKNTDMKLTMASNLVVLEDWAWDELWDFLKMPHARRLRWTLSIYPNAPANKVMLKEQLYNRFMV